jgi:hypothetical protein
VPLLFMAVTTVLAAGLARVLYSPRSLEKSLDRAGDIPLAPGLSPR